MYLVCNVNNLFNLHLLIVSILFQVMECTNKPIPTESGRALTLKHSPFALAKHQEHAHASYGSHQEKQADLKSISSPPHSV